jgi:hypothetical protein
MDTLSSCELCKNILVSLSLFHVTKIGIRFAVYLLQFFKMFYGLMNKPVFDMVDKSVYILYFS